MGTQEYLRVHSLSLPHASRFYPMRQFSLFALLVSLSACTNSLSPSAVVPPQCLAPAALSGTYDPRAPSYAVLFRNGVNVSEEAQRLARRYGFTLNFVWNNLRGFSAEMTPHVVAQLRCERTVTLVEFDVVAQP